MKNPTLSRRLAAEFVGSLLLVVAVVGSGIMAERLAGGNTAIALLANTAATGCSLLFLILMLGPISGSHMNPVVSMSSRLNGNLSTRDTLYYSLGQCSGGVVGVALANVMFGLPLFMQSTRTRAGAEQLLGEFVATFGLIGVVNTIGRRNNIGHTAIAVAAYISAAYWFTSSTSFANPAVTIARSMTDTFAGIRPVDVPAFLIVQFVAGVASTYFFGWLQSDDVI